MAAGWQLRELVSALRAETGRSLNVALGVNEREALAVRLRMTQELLATQHEWPHLTAEADIALLAEGRTYSFPATLPFEAIQSVMVRAGLRDIWTPVQHGIGTDQYNQTDSEAGDTSWPVQRWRDLAGSIEVWPIPSQAGVMRVRGKRVPPPLIADSDVSLLDGNLIVLFAAADLLARQGSEDAQLVLARGQKLLRSILVRQDSDKSQPFVIGGPVPGGPGGHARPGIRAPR